MDSERDPRPDGRVRLEPLAGPALLERLDDLAALRVRVFREWPYLYDGDAAYEARYLRAFAEADGALLVAALVDDGAGGGGGSGRGGRMVGASTALPLAAEHDELVAPWREAGLDPAAWYYLAESVLLPRWRGRGLGRRFFEAREARARELGFGRTCFAAVLRDEGDPRRPEGYRELAPFWRRLGYEPREELVAELAWKELEEAEATPKRLRFWSRELAGSVPAGSGGAGRSG